jgi:hypothetical protein
MSIKKPRMSFGLSIKIKPEMSLKLLLKWNLRWALNCLLKLNLRWALNYLLRVKPEVWLYYLLKVKLGSYLLKVKPEMSFEMTWIQSDRVVAVSHGGVLVSIPLKIRIVYLKIVQISVPEYNSDRLVIKLISI